MAIHQNSQVPWFYSYNDNSVNVFVCRLQDAHEREFIICDKYLEQIFGCSRMKFAEIPQRLNPLLHPPDPIVINHVISVEGGAESKQTACYDIDVEVCLIFLKIFRSPDKY